MLIVLSGLPGTGKTTIARKLAIVLAAVYLRIDSIEQSIRDAGRPVEGERYSVAHAVAEDNLRLGRIVVADCVNPWALTRCEWRVADPLQTPRPTGDDERAGASDLDSLPSLFTAVQEQLGLKLESARGPVDVIVIEHAERPTLD